MNPTKNERLVVAGIALNRAEVQAVVSLLEEVETSGSLTLKDGESVRSAFARLRAGNIERAYLSVGDFAPEVAEDIRQMIRKME